ncbi:MAG: hypothetical protein JSU85_07055 [Candidatus Zixiibacteriota bacterium]|nr:MAG: hypothetical protein JSU85_07055 [candidate division Zixibacteria bacterium]
MLNLNTILGEKTTIKEIKRLNGGTRIHIKDGKISFNNYWNPEIPGRVDIKEFVNKNNELLEESLKLTGSMDNPKVILLSGGEDGRRIGVSAKKIGLPVSFATQECGFLQGFDDNIIIAERVSEYLNIPHIKSELPSAKSSFKDRLIRDYWLGCETHYHDWIIPLLRILPASSLIYDGIAGDVTINGHWARLFPERYLNNDIDQVARMFCGGENTFHLNPEKLDSSLFERIRDQLLKYPDCPARVDYFYLMNRARRTISLMDQLFNLMGHKVCCPFLYYPLFMQSLSLDPKYKLEVLYQRLCMAEIDPGISAIPSTRDRLDDGYIIDKSQDVEGKSKLIIENIKIRSDISDIFPSLRARIWAFKTAKILHLKKMTSRLMWRITPVSRMSAFLDWLEDSNSPEFPIGVEEPGFLKKNLIS